MYEAPRRRVGPLLFVPARWQRAVVLTWLKRVHAWTGFWGALLFLLMGSSGFLLNHRTLMKIDTSAPVDVNEMNVAVPGGIASPEALGAWAQQALALPVEGKAPPPVGGEGPKRFLGRALSEPQTWVRVFSLADTKVTVSYVPGAPAAQLKREALGLPAIIKNLHKGVGLGVGWVLLIDTVAGALVTMALTGFLLWSRLHGPRLLAGAIASGSLVWAVLAGVGAGVAL